MLFNILTRDEQVLREHHIPEENKGRLVITTTEDMYYKGKDNLILSLNDIEAVVIKKAVVLAPLLEKLCLVVYADYRKIAMKKTYLLDYETTDVDGVKFITKFIDGDGKDVTEDVYKYLCDNYVEVLDQITPIVTHTCPRCGNLYIGDRCEPCYKKMLEEAKKYRTRQDYSWKPDPIFNKANKRDKDLHMGFELEMEDPDYELEPNDGVAVVHETLNRGGSELTVYCKYDGSLEDGGVEMVSHPRTLDYFMNRYNEFDNCYNTLKDDGWRSEKGGSCGLHVHIDKKFLGKNVDYVCAKIGYIFALFWDELLCFSRRSSSGLHYCHKNDIEINDNKDTVIDKIKYQKYDGDRYVAVNNKPNNTLEIRLWRGTLNTRTVMATLDLTRAIVLCAKKYSINTLQTISFGDIINKMKYQENKDCVIARLTEKGFASRLTPTRKQVKGVK